MEGTCTWCLMDLTVPSACLQVQARGTVGETSAAMLAELQRDAYSARLERKAEIIADAQSAGWDVMLNSYTITPPITTWHGDPICEAHLYAVAEQQRQPQTVRMAQWKR